MEKRGRASLASPSHLNVTSDRTRAVRSWIMHRWEIVCGHRGWHAMSRGLCSWHVFEDDAKGHKFVTASQGRAFAKPDGYRFSFLSFSPSQFSVSCNCVDRTGGKRVKYVWIFMNRWLWARIKPPDGKMEKNYSYVFPKIKREIVRVELFEKSFDSLVFSLLSFFLFVDTHRSTNNWCARREFRLFINANIICIYECK